MKGKQVAPYLRDCFIDELALGGRYFAFPTNSYCPRDLHGNHSSYTYVGSLEW